MAITVVIDGVEYVPKNSGNCNSGDSNSGDSNSGHWNSGHWNSGNCNSGNWNSGNLNSGNLNSGDCNSGNLNSGDSNSGHSNSGNCNSGNCNSGNWNSGNLNSGNWNSGSRNSGFFCTDTPCPSFFDKPTTLTLEEALSAVPCVDLPVGCKWVAREGMTCDEKQAHPNYATFGGYLKVLENDFKAAFRQAWSTTISEVDKQRFIALPNFDADKFLQITGVDVRTAGAVASSDEITIGGKLYRAVAN